MSWTERFGGAALVTGASSGLGREFARALAARGMDLVLVARREQALEEVAAALRSAHGVRVAVVPQDLIAAEADVAIFARVEELGMSIGLLVNNAGLLHMQAFVDIPPERYEQLWRVNLFGPFLGSQAVAESMQQAGGGSIVNVSSVDGLSAKNGLGAYVPTKWGLRGLTKVSALELGQLGIRVNTVCPEAGGPGMRKDIMPEGIDIDPMDTIAFTHGVIPYNRERPGIEIIRDIARMILFLASDESLSCTGGDYPGDAGWTAGHRLKFNPGYKAS